MVQIPKGVHENIPLAPYTTYKLGGAARYFTETADEAELGAALTWASNQQLPLFVLGGGSNILVADSGFRGLVIHFVNSEIRIQNTGTPEHRNTGLVVGAGALVKDLIEQTLAANLVGLECMAGVPGLMGGAIRGNAGTFGQQIGDYVVEVTAISRSGQHRVWLGRECDFSYRHSIFKESGDIIVSCRLKLENGDGAAGRQLVTERLSRRAQTQPLEPSAGCVFKNFRFENLNLDTLRSKGLDVDKFSEHRKLPAAYIIESAGLKGTRVGDIEVSSVHANFLINHGQGTAAQVAELMSQIKKTVQDKYGLELQEEIQRVGF
jgi:UDP-N-acetylmuramate dehydrogenase